MLIELPCYDAILLYTARKRKLRAAWQKIVHFESGVLSVLSIWVVSNLFWHLLARCDLDWLKALCFNVDCYMLLGFHAAWAICKTCIGCKKTIQNMQMQNCMLPCTHDHSRAARKRHRDSETSEFGLCRYGSLTALSRALVSVLWPCLPLCVFIGCPRFFLVCHVLSLFLPWFPQVASCVVCKMLIRCLAYLFVTSCLCHLLDLFYIAIVCQVFRCVCFGHNLSEVDLPGVFYLPDVCLDFWPGFLDQKAQCTVQPGRRRKLKTIVNKTESNKNKKNMSAPDMCLNWCTC